MAEIRIVFKIRCRVNKNGAKTIPYGAQHMYQTQFLNQQLGSSTTARLPLQYVPDKRTEKNPVPVQSLIHKEWRNSRSIVFIMCKAPSLLKILCSSSASSAAHTFSTLGHTPSGPAAFPGCILPSSNVTSSNCKSQGRVEGGRARFIGNCRWMDGGGRGGEGARFVHCKKERRYNFR
ncbi:hypothetical protein QQF64_011861 [Cirrhinus molitorella]|uniref:Uncharacterized protein n=1 Tax=Cirrhinus molitorella TaxID=172907 RepID=A0ABR3LWC0_9TELE